jgi:hypothetical protein
MVFAVPASKRSLKQNRYEFTVPGDKKKYSIPLVKFLPAGALESVSEQEDVSIFDILTFFDEAEVTEGTAAAVRTLDQEQINALMADWQKESGVSVGESSASEQTS